MPARFLAYGGNVLWHEQGMRFSWRVMVRARAASDAHFVRSNQLSGRSWHVSPDEYPDAAPGSGMSSQPDLILQLAHHIRDDAERRGSRAGRSACRVPRLAERSPQQPCSSIPRSTSRVTDGVTPQWVMPAPSTPPPHTKVVL